MNKNQQGFSHLILLIGIPVIIGIVVLAGFVVVRANKNTDEQPTARVVNQSEARSKTKTVTNKSEEQSATASPATSTSSQASNAPAKTATPKTTNGSTAVSAPVSQPASPTRRTIQFIKGGAGQNGNDIDVTMYLSENQAGKCTYRFSAGGTTAVEQYNYVVFGNQCLINIATADFPQSGSHDLALSFVSNDGLITADTTFSGIAVTK